MDRIGIISVACALFVLLAAATANADEYEVWQAAQQERNATASRIATGFSQLRALRDRLAQKRAERTTASSEVDRAVRDLETQRTRVTEQIDRVRRHEARLRELAAELERALDELRRGLFCSQCHRPRSQIERDTGRSFQEHLTEVSGVPEPARPEDFEQVRQHYGQLMAAERSQLEGATRELQARREQVTRAEEALQQRRDRVAQIEHEIATTLREIGELEDEVFRLYVTWRRLVQVEYHQYDRYVALGEAADLVQAEELRAQLRLDDPSELRRTIEDAASEIESRAEERRRERLASLQRFREQARVEAEGYRDLAYALGMIYPGAYWAWPSPVVPDRARARLLRRRSRATAELFRQRRESIEEYRRIYRERLEWQSQIGGIWSAPSIVFDPEGPRVLETQSW